METDEMKQCPYCAEMIRAEASKCRYCGGNLGTKARTGKGIYWQRVRDEKKIAGVCTGLARQFGMPILLLPLRLAFVATTFLWLFGPILYILLWILMPAPESGKEVPPMNSVSAAGEPGVPSGSAADAVGGTV